MEPPRTAAVPWTAAKMPYAVARLVARTRSVDEGFDGGVLDAHRCPPDEHAGERATERWRRPWWDPRGVVPAAISLEFLPPDSLMRLWDDADKLDRGR